PSARPGQSAGQSAIGLAKPPPLGHRRSAQEHPASPEPAMNRRALALAASLAVAALPGAAWAHAGHGELGGQLGGLAAGLAHPLLGLAHLLARVGVGLWATRLGGRAVWAVPLAFLAAMAAGGAAGLAGLALPGLE